MFIVFFMGSYISKRKRSLILKLLATGNFGFFLSQSLNWLLISELFGKEYFIHALSVQRVLNHFSTLLHFVKILFQ